VRDRAAGLLLGYLADRAFGDPRRFHPVAGFGRLARGLETRLYADRHRHGTVFTLTLVAGAATAGALVDRLTRDRPVAATLVTAAVTWTVLGGRSLGWEALLVHGHLERGDLSAAREQVTHLVGRDPATLDASGVARATVESVAENTSDAVVAPLLWGAVAGPAGLVGYRAANTLDAMVGHRSPRYERFGRVSARLDDAANVVPARVSALLAAALAPAVGGSSRAALRAWRRDAPQHPSPNAGPVEASFAGALGVRLGGVNVYGGVVDDRGTLGDGTAPTPADVRRAMRLADLVGRAALSLAVVSNARPRRRR
jgi:adenosylcobinamide-phosphate synthase